MNKEEVLKYQSETEKLDAEDFLKWVYSHFDKDKIALATSLSIEDQCVTDMLCKIVDTPIVFTLDTGRLFPETYDALDATMKKYSLDMKILFPEAKAVREMTESKGINLFYDSVENRKLCCRVRKVEPLNKMLATLDAWITGLRKEQSVTRTDLHKLEWDEGHGMAKINPIVDWTYDDVWNYIKENNVPYNPLQDKHFPSIGCAPCTRPVKPGEDMRAGRWWWENPESKECGLHVNEKPLLNVKIINK